ncbi:MAG: hypothetical protein KAS30_04170, partial [Candidatus Diapherotrites archaeon]|nr:hypothetical protein [Candidatus Diapherotrites archaeon]
NTTILFRTDESDVNTLTNYKGTEFTEHVYPTQWKNKRNLMVSGLKKVDVGFSRGIRKTELNKTEKIIDRLFKEVAPLMNDFVFQHNVKLKQAVTVATTVIDIINDVLSFAGITTIQIQTPAPFQDIPFLTIPNFETLVGNRIGMLLLESDEFVEDKLILIEEKYTLQNSATTSPEYLIADNLFQLFDQSSLEELQGINSSGESPLQNVLDSDNLDFISAENIWKTFHSHNSFVPNIDGVVDWVNGSHGQYKKYDTQQFRLCCDDIRKLVSNNKMRWCEKDGEFFGSLDWNPFTKVATGKFKINEIFYRHLTSKKIIPNGSTRTR